MAKQKTIPELEAEKAANEKKLTQLQHKKQRLENRISYYDKGERTARAHRLITRGAAVESVAPLVKTLGEVEFYSLTERIFSLPEVERIVEETAAAHNAAEQSGGD